MNRLQFLLIKLSEEASEISQIALKTAQFGMTEKHPDLDENNQERIRAELNDLNAIVMLLNDEFDFAYEVDMMAVTQKVAKIEKFYNYSKRIGMIRE